MRKLIIGFLAGAFAASAGFAGRQPVGGGSTDGGFAGEYFANPDLKGTPVFSRRDVRIRFDWGEKLPVIGTNADAVRNFPKDNFSARWTGTVIARFSEPYTLKVESDEGVRLMGRPSGAPGWKVLIDHWKSHKRAADTAVVKLGAGEPYDLKVEYREGSGPAVVGLFWSSPSTPEEVIDPLSAGAISGNSYPPHMFADAAKLGQAWKPEDLDETGWPKADVSWALEGGWRSAPGRYVFRFNGKAEVTIAGATFVAGDKTCANTLPAGEGYDPATNRTTGAFDWPTELAITIRMSKTQRSADAPPGSGFTGLQVMKPVAPGAKESHGWGEICTRGLREAFGPYPIFRWQTTGLSDAVTWSQRTLPSHPRLSEQFAHNQTNLEFLVQMANEMGRDIQICFGGSVDGDYLKKLALLCRYGSGGKEPYTEEMDAPAYPPLNPNLRIYLEHGNEMGWSAIQPRKWHQDLAEKAQKNDGDWQIVNFDGLMKGAAGEATYRYHALRTLRAGLRFREVFGDAAMMDRVRPVLFGQGGQQYEAMMLSFVDNYFNNADGKPHVKEPHPVNYYLFGTGVAIYYGSANVYGNLPEEWFRDGSFESLAVADGTAQIRPSGTPWEFGGTAGICDAKLPRRDAIKPAAPAPPAAKAPARFVGIKFVVGPKDIYVYQLGRMIAQDNKGDHRVAIFPEKPKKADRGDEGQPLSSVTVAVGKEAGPGDMAYGPVEFVGWPLNWESFRQAPQRLVSGSTYYLVSEESPSGEKIAGENNAVVADPAIAVAAAVTSADGIQFDEFAPGGRCAGLVNMVFAEAPEGFPVPPDTALPICKNHKQETMGQQVAFILGKGSVAQTVDFGADGEYAVLFRAAASQIKNNPLSVFVDGQCVLEEKGAGAFRKPAEGLYAYSTEPIPLKAGKHEVKFVGQGEDRAGVFLDGIQVCSIDTIMESIPSKGQETSGKASDKWAVTCRKMADFARLWGVVPCTYEGGWSLGGDWDAGGMNHWLYCKFKSPKAVQAGFRSAGLYSEAGGWMFAYGTYDQFPKERLDEAGKYPLRQAVVELGKTWTHEPKNGVRLPGTLGPGIDHYGSPGGSAIFGPTCWGKPNYGPAMKGGEWKSWIVIASKTGEYSVATDTVGAGKIEVLADNSVRIAEGQAGQMLAGKVFLARGQHAIRVRCTEGQVELKQIDVR